jgi:hypothetical protein
MIYLTTYQTSYFYKLIGPYMPVPPHQTYSKVVMQTYKMNFVHLF